MRRDIKIDVFTHDINFTSGKARDIYPFGWISNPNGLERYIYGEIELPMSVSEDMVKTDGVNIVIPYTSIYKEFYIRIKRKIGNSTYVYMQNPVDGSNWFLAKTGLYGREKTNAYASRLIEVSESSYRILINKDVVEIYNGENIDFNIAPANAQNKNMLLLCVPGNNYRYPLTGVGLVRFINSNIDYTNLSAVLQREFSNDGVQVIAASYDHNTKYLDLQLNTEQVDNE